MWGWGRGGPLIFFLLSQIIFFCELKPHANFQNHSTTPFGRKVGGREKKMVATSLGFGPINYLEKISAHTGPSAQHPIDMRGNFLVDLSANPSTKDSESYEKPSSSYF